MQRTIWRVVHSFRSEVRFQYILLIILTTTLSAFAVSLPPGTVKEVSVINTSLHPGGGASLSPDGQQLVYVGDDGLHLVNLSNGNDFVFTREASAGIEVFGSPTFSPDGKRILVSASGGTVYYPSDIYSIAVDGSNIRKLTESVEAKPRTGGNAVYARYFYAPSASPSSTQILVDTYDAGRKVDEVGIIDDSEPGLRIVADGEPLFWSSDGHAVYYRSLNGLVKFDLLNNTSRKIDVLGNVIGRLPNEDTAVVDNGESIRLVGLDNGVVGKVFPFQISHSETMLVTFRGNVSAIPDRLILGSVQWTKDGTILLSYSGPRTERFKVLRTVPPSE